MKFEDQVSIAKKLLLLHSDKNLSKSIHQIILKCVANYASDPFFEKPEIIEKMIDLLNEALGEPSISFHIREKIDGIINELKVVLKEVLKKKEEFAPLVSELLIAEPDLYKIQLGKVFDNLAGKIYKEGASVAFTVFTETNPQQKIVSWILESVPTLAPHLNKVQSLVHHLIMKLEHKKK